MTKQNESNGSSGMGISCGLFEQAFDVLTAVKHADDVDAVVHRLIKHNVAATEKLRRYGAEPLSVQVRLIS